MAKKIFGIDFGTNVIKVYKKGEGIILLERTAVSTVGKGKAKERSQLAKSLSKCLKKHHQVLMFVSRFTGVLYHILTIWFSYGIIWDKRFRARKRSVIASFI